MNASAQSGLAQQFAAGDLPDNRIVRLPPLVRRYSWHVSLPLQPRAGARV